MAVYSWQCHECKIVWDRSYPLAKNPARTRCPKCKKLSERVWTPTPVHFKGAGWTGKNSVTGLNKRGGSDEINLKLQDGCKKRMDTGWQHYARYTPSKEWIDVHASKKLSHTETREKIKAVEKLSDTLYDKAGIDKNEVYKKKPQ